MLEILIYNFMKLNIDMLHVKVIELLNKRGYENDEEIKSFLNCDLQCLSKFTSNSCIVACEFIHKHISLNLPIFIHGDFDADGISSTSILFEFIYNDLGYKKVIPYIPDRVDEGYGLTPKSLQSIYDIYLIKFPQDLKITPDLDIQSLKPLIISVDCGVKETTLIDDEWIKKFNFIITDHHNFKLDNNNEIACSKKAVAIIHPKFELKNDHTEICGAFTIYKLIEFYNVYFNLGFNLDKYHSLIALATICDVMPLIKENRAIVISGLSKFVDIKFQGLEKLAQIASIDLNKIKSFDLGFKLGPRINAAGRLGAAIDAVKLIVSRDRNLQNDYATNLDLLNKKRQDITQEYLDLAIVQSEMQKENNILLIDGHDWKEGIIGLVSGKLCEMYKKPVITFSIHDEIVGSARSPENFHITNMLNHHQQYLHRYGGHAQAAGMRVKTVEFDKFKTEVCKYTNENFIPVDKVNLNNYDLEIDLVDIDKLLYDSINLLEPFGNQNNKPKFKLSEYCQINFVRSFGKDSQFSEYKVTQVIEGVNYNFKAISWNKNYKMDQSMIIVTIEYSDWDKDLYLSLIQ